VFGPPDFRQSFHTIKYSGASGELLWRVLDDRSRASPRAVAVDADQAVVVTGLLRSNGRATALTIKYLPPPTGFDLDVPFFSQRADPWGSEEYNSASQWAPAAPTISRWGCTLTSAAMVLRYHGITTLPGCTDNACPELEGLEVNPLNLNAWLLNEPGGYYGNGDLNLYAVASLSQKAGSPFIYNKFHGWDADLVREEIENGRPVIVDVDLSNIGLDGSHFVVAKGIQGSTFLLNDPDLRDAVTLDVYGQTHRSIRTFVPTNTDLSVISLAATPPLDFLVTDPQDRRTGVDPVTGLELREIPAAQYVFQEPLADDGETGVTSGPGTREFRMRKPIPGVYAIELASSVVQTYRIATYTLDREGNPFFIEPLRTTTQGVIESYRLVYSPEPGMPVSLELAVDIDIKPGSEPNSVNCGNQNAVVAVGILSTDAFDATGVDHETITFQGAREMHVDSRTGRSRRHQEDVDGDGDADLVFHFRVADTDLTCLSAEGTLKGNTLDGLPFFGTDKLRMMGGR